MPAKRPNNLLALSLVILYISYFANAGVNHVDIEDNDFAEFEDFEIEEDNVGVFEKDDDNRDENLNPNIDVKVEEDDDEATVENEDNEFEHVDEDEFEGFEKDGPKVDQKSSEGPKITFAKLPAHLRSNWESYYLEIIILTGLVLYFFNFFVGRAKNQKIADTFYSSFKQLLQDNFALVGDDGKLENSEPGLMKESENVYLIWCSGRTCCESVLIELRLVKRQDLVAIVTNFFRPTNDQVHIKVFMNHEDMDTYVMSLANKKTASRLTREMADVSVFCPERKSAEKYGLPSNFVLMSEIGEAATSLLDTRVVSLINKIPELIDSIHFSDQYSGPKQTDEGAPSKMPDTKKMLIFTFNLLFKNGNIHSTRLMSSIHVSWLVILFIYHLRLTTLV